MIAHPTGRSYIPAYPRVQRTTDHGFVEAAIVEAGARVNFSSGPRVAPLFLTVEHAGGLREGVIVYAFHANRRETRNRPENEHRAQIRYGDVNKASWRLADHRVAFDPAAVDVTLVVAVEPEAGLIVALDPVLYNPLPLGISVFWKDADVEAARRSGWHAWERDNLTGAKRTATRATLGVETLLAVAPARILDLIRFERVAQALRLDPALRLRLAEDFAAAPDAPMGLHELEREYRLSAREILEIVGERSRLAMAVRGGVAEHHLGRLLREHSSVVEAAMGLREGPPDYVVRLRDGPSVSIECKNASPRPYADGTPKVEVQKTRTSKGDPASRLYDPAAFDVLAVCMYGPTGRWTFRFRRSIDLLAHPGHPGKIAPLQRITDEWATDLKDVL